MDEVCVICSESCTPNATDVVAVREKGSQRINEVSIERGDEIEVVPGQKMHIECRRLYCKQQNIDRANRTHQSPSTSSSNAHRTLVRTAEQSFSFITDCLYCGTEVLFQAKKRGVEAFRVTTIETKAAILNVCSQRRDAWSEVVQARVLHVHDLPAAEAVYHQSCSVNFRTGRQIPAVYVGLEKTSKKRKTGRPQNKECHDAFIAVADYLQVNDEEQLNTINDLCEKMKNLLVDSHCSAYSNTYMKAMLLDHFKNQIVITEVNGKENVVSLKTTADKILQEFHSQSFEDNPEAEKISIIQTAAKLIKEDIKEITMSGVSYPEVDPDVEKQLEFLPQTLRIFLGNIIAGKHPLKLASIGQAVMQAARPKAIISPLQIGLAVQLHHSFASRFLIDSLNSHGFCSSYQEVQLFSKNTSLEESTDIPSFSGEFIQYVADNVDHNVRTLDGRDTFHGMGMIAAVTPGPAKQMKRVPRVYVGTQEIPEAARIQIVQPLEPRRSDVEIRYSDIAIRKVTDPSSNIETLWNMSLLFDSKARMGWSGMMQTVLEGDYQGQSSVFFLPMIDMNPSDNTCIYSTLKFLAEHAKRHNVHPIVTFDQPLWWKAFNLIKTEAVGSIISNVIVRLGGFHTEMSFLGSIGHLMAESGLRELLELVYAPNAVDHILTGKAIGRAVRAHLLIDAALNALLYARALQVPIPQLQNGAVSQRASASSYEDPPTAPEPTQLPPDKLCSNQMTAPQSGVQLLEEARHLFTQLIEKEMSCEEAVTKDVWDAINQRIRLTINSLKEQSRTSALWLQYIEMVGILKVFIKAERTANWELHLQTLSQMLPFLAASGHNLYVKCVKLYLQSMSTLAQDNPDVYRGFMSGLHVVRRSDRYWAGLSADLVIEQALMRSLKTRGGLTRGRGMTEHQRLTWLLAMPVCAEINSTMQELTGVKYNSGEQNKDMTNARKERDTKDTLTILACLQNHSPFSSEEPDLRNIMTGVHGDSAVNVDNARQIGEKIITTMNGQLATEYTFKKCNQAITLASKSAILIDNEQVQVDPQLLFQRLILASSDSIELPTIFKYELCSYPAALFDSSLMLRQANKPVLANTIWSKLSPQVTAEKVPQEHGIRYILDGGALLHRVVWPPLGSVTFRRVLSLYSTYIAKKYGRPIIVFDGYQDDLSTKQMTQQRRSSGKVGATVTFTEDTKVTMKKDVFLANPKNKQNFLELLRRSLAQNQIETYQADGDADVLIVKKAVESARSQKTTLVGDDTDLLILLLFHTEPGGQDLYFIPEPKGNTLVRRVWNVQKVQAQLGVEVCRNILFIHAFLGCDTTSRIYSIGKGASFQKFVTSVHFREQAKVFQQTSSTQEEIAAAGENALVLLFNGRFGQHLDELRYQRYQQKLATKTTKLEPTNLPPTASAAKFHSFRAYAQVKQWKEETVDVRQWGWKTTGGKVNPVMTDLPPAPDNLLRIIRCNCATGCSTLRCSCLKHRLECSPACGHCKGIGCCNSPAQETVDDTSDAN